MKFEVSRVSDVGMFMCVFSYICRVDPDSALYADLVTYKKDGADHILLNCTFKVCFFSCYIVEYYQDYGSAIVFLFKEHFRMLQFLGLNC